MQGESMTEKRRPVSLHPDEVSNTREGHGRNAGGLTLEMPFNDKSDRIREGGQVIYEGVLYEVSVREDLRPPIVAERTIEFSLRKAG